MQQVVPDISDFQRKVYEAVSRIPRGFVSTYGAVAEVIACRSCRAIGQALKRNPFAPAVPCHRVIASDLSIGGFQGKSGGASILRKIKLLKQEGIVFRNGRLADSSRIISL
ncbi:MAG: methyltransferase [Lentisphaerae bacterium RIFOXYA12_FULL_48_11]|nr:MAG: methyltransferase [Lentisphaerae bacterium RIFOXYA12_FULL_48_11]